MTSMKTVVPAESDDDMRMGAPHASNVKKAPSLASQQSVKLPGCAYHIAISRANHFSKIALFAFISTTTLSFLKYYIALQGEDTIIELALQDTAGTLAQSVRLQMEGDLSALDGVANLWHLDSRLPRETFRNYIKSRFYAKNLNAMQTVILTERVQPHNRDAIETDPDSVQLRRDCCTGTKYDVPERNLYCRKKAKNQCNILGEDRYYFTEKTKDGVVQAARNDKERLIVMYQEPLEENPGPTGLDMLTLATRRDAWWESARTGKKAMTKRMERVFSPGEFGLLVWNNLFVDKALDGNKSVRIEGVNLRTKQELDDQGKEPYSIASVVAVYEIQYMLTSVIETVFGRALENTRVWLLDERAGTGDTERILAMWDSSLTAAQMADVVMADRAKTKDELIQGVPAHVIKKFPIGGTTEGTELCILLIPSENYMASMESQNPMMILLLSLTLAAIAQIERWIGHPIVISSTRLWQAKIEQELRCEVEPDIVRSASLQAIAVVSAEQNSQYVSPA